MVDALGPALQRSYQQFADGIAARLMRRYYVQNLSACRLKIAAVVAGLGEEDGGLVAFLRQLEGELEKKVRPVTPAR